MKKMYTLLLLMSNVLITSCMEQEQQRPQYNKRNSNEDGAFPPVSPTSAMPAHYSQQKATTSIPFQAMQSNWQKLNAIANITRNTIQSVITDEVELTPLYLSKKQFDDKPFLSTLPIVETNTDRMQKLYTDTMEFAHNQSDKKLICLITDMRTVKNIGITEDMMGEFAMKQAPILTNTAKCMIPLLFSCFKKYFTTTTAIQEAIPKNDNSLSSYTPLNILFTCKSINPYPTYLELRKSIDMMLKYHPSTLLTFFYFLYHPSNVSPKITPPESYRNLAEAFYEKASNFLLTENGHFKVVQMINNAKESHTIATEQDLGYAILEFEPSLFEHVHYFMNSPISNLTLYTLTKVKNRISLLCILIEEFNKTREKKEVPSCEQYNSYQLQQKINLTPPDSFNATLLDSTQYAFAEFEQLVNNIDELRDADDENVQQWVNHFYPSKK